MVRKRRANSINRDDRPCFYKVIFDPQAEQLRIPPEFVTHITEEAVETALVKGPCGKYWNMKVGEDEDGVFFHGGWKKFLTEQHLQRGDFLLLHYDGRMAFHVRIFDNEGLER